MGVVKVIQGQSRAWLLMVVSIVQNLHWGREVFGVVEEGDRGMGEDQFVVGKDVGKHAKEFAGGGPESRSGCLVEADLPGYFVKLLFFEEEVEAGEARKVAKVVVQDVCFPVPFYFFSNEFGAQHFCQFLDFRFGTPVEHILIKFVLQK